MNDAGKASPFVGAEITTGFMAMAHAGLILHLAHQTASVISINAVVGRIAVAHGSRPLQFVGSTVSLVQQHTGNGPTASIVIAGAGLQVFYAQVVDRTQYHTEDTYGINIQVANLIGYLAFTDDVAVTVVVAFETVVIADGEPLPVAVGVLQDVLNEDVALLSEIEATGIAAGIHIVGKRQQFAMFNDEWTARRSAALGEDVLIVLPLGIDINGAFSDGVFIVNTERLACTILALIPPQHVFV